MLGVLGGDGNGEPLVADATEDQVHHAAGEAETSAVGTAACSSANGVSAPGRGTVSVATLLLCVVEPLGEGVRGEAHPGGPVQVGGGVVDCAAEYLEQVLVGEGVVEFGGELGDRLEPQAFRVDQGAVHVE